MTEELRVDQFRRDRSAIDAQERAAGTRRLGVDHPGDDFLAGARLAEDEHGGIVAGHQGRALDDVLKSRIFAHDGIRQLLSAQPFQQRFLVGLGRCPHGSHLAEPLVVFQGHREWLEECLDQANVRIFERRAGLCHEHDDAGWVVRIAERPATTSAVIPGGTIDARRSRRDCATFLVQDLALAAPRQKILEPALVAGCTCLRQEIIGHRNAHRHRFQAGMLPIDLANEQLPDGPSFAESRQSYGSTPGFQYGGRPPARHRQEPSDRLHRGRIYQISWPSHFLVRLFLSYITALGVNCSCIGVSFVFQIITMFLNIMQYFSLRQQAERSILAESKLFSARRNCLLCKYQAKKGAASAAGSETVPSSFSTPARSVRWAGSRSSPSAKAFSAPVDYLQQNPGLLTGPKP